MAMTDAVSTWKAYIAATAAGESLTLNHEP